MKKVALTILILAFTLQSFSQSKRDKIKALKVSFITERLELTKTEAEKFWPIYNAYDETTSKIKHTELRALKKEIKENIASLTEKKASELLDKFTKAERKLHEQEYKLSSDLKTIIPAKKVLLLQVAEEEFKKKMFDEWKRMKNKNKS
ncbi:hypothetical protein PW52_14440 [Tamlana sedimentorum]|uniref:Sensor of ECF-type sigma factor n=1 Tax=Neotamlana sedimentorum TaxID=1435349 RepID=A0A0D7W2I0_9FLAO|nr:hypothetical protein [Tamlana sedimentorum]KJD33291.1 hypothetical protein PW52_14440 [Tamlana sedimentorum]